MVQDPMSTTSATGSSFVATALSVSKADLITEKLTATAAAARAHATAAARSDRRPKIDGCGEAFSNASAASAPKSRRERTHPPTWAHGGPHR